MPFPPQNGMPFTRAGVEWLAPNQSGVYGIYNAALWVYVGKADDLRARLLQHLSNPDILRHQPTHYVTMITTDGDNAERSLIVELRPVANQRVG
jgi:excinuclease UvrABC nuclease subunit